MRRTVAISIALLLATSCIGDDPTAPGGRAAERPAGRPDAAPVLVATTSDGAIAIDGASGSVIAGGDGSVTALGGSTLFHAAVDDGRTRVTTLDPRTGLAGAVVRIPGRYDLTTASVSGRRLALVVPAPGSGGEIVPGVPTPRARTTIAVVDPSGRGRERTFRLAGNFEPEAFSIDDERLFLLQYLPAEAPIVYRVTVLDLDRGTVVPVRGRFAAPPERMPGVRLAQAFDPVTAQLYTLYANEPGAGAVGAEAAGGYGQPSGGEGWAGGETFVHVLNLRRGWAYCAGVPEPMWGSSAKQLAISPSADGSALYIVDAGSGLVAEMDTETLEIERTAEIDLRWVLGSRISAATSPDGGTLFVAADAVGTPVSAIDTERFGLAGRFAAPTPVSGLGSALDGSSLLVAGAGRITLLDPGSGSVRREVATPGVPPIVGLTQVPS